MRAFTTSCRVEPTCARGIVYPPIERALLPVIGNVAYPKSARGSEMCAVQ